jgi:hypothetical protein
VRREFVIKPGFVHGICEKALFPALVGGIQYRYRYSYSLSTVFLVFINGLTSYQVVQTKEEAGARSPSVPPSTPLVVGLCKEPALAHYGRPSPLVADTWHLNTPAGGNSGPIRISGIRPTATAAGRRLVVLPSFSSASTVTRDSPVTGNTAAANMAAASKSSSAPKFRWIGTKSLSMGSLPKFTLSAASFKTESIVVNRPAVQTPGNCSSIAAEGSQGSPALCIQEAHSTCSPSPPVAGTYENSPETLDLSQSAVSSARAGMEDLPQVEPVDLSKPVLANAKENITSSLIHHVDDAEDPSYRTVHEDKKWNGAGPAASPDMPTSGPQISQVGRAVTELPSIGVEEPESGLTTVTMEGDAVQVSADLVVDPGLGLESLLDQAEGKMLTLLVTEGPDGQYVIVSDATSNGESTAGDLGDAARDLNTMLKEPSLVEQLESELRALKKNLNDSVVKVASCGEHSKTVSVPDVNVSKSEDFPSDHEGNNSDREADNSDHEGKISVYEESAPGLKPNDSIQDAKAADHNIIANDHESSAGDQSNNPDARAESSAAEDSIGIDNEEMPDNSFTGDLIEDSLDNLEQQVSDLVDFITDPLSGFVKEENNSARTPSGLATESRMFRKRKRLGDSCSPCRAESKKGKLASQDQSENMTETIEIEAELVNLHPENGGDAAAPSESPMLRCKSWKSCRDEFFPQLGQSKEELETNIPEGKRSSKRSRRLMSVTGSPGNTAPDDSLTRGHSKSAKRSSSVGHEEEESFSVGPADEESLPDIPVKEESCSGGPGEEDGLSDREEIEEKPSSDEGGEGKDSDDDSICVPSKKSSPRKKGKRKKAPAKLVESFEKNKVKKRGRKSIESPPVRRSMSSGKSNVLKEKSKVLRSKTVLSSDEEENEVRREQKKKSKPTVKKTSRESSVVETSVVETSTPTRGRVKRAAALRAEKTFTALPAGSKEDGDQSDISPHNSDDSMDNFELAKEVDTSQLYRRVKKGSGAR